MNISFSKIRHNDLSCYVKEGFGGQQIQKWPVYGFFLMYASGEKERAFKEFENWYFCQFKKYRSVPKNEGGMFKGSLYALIEKRSGNNPEEVSDSVVKLIIHERVGQRFTLFDSIADKGYNPNVERIDGVKKDNLVFLKGGHHRAAILLALGYNELPGVFVFPNTLSYRCFLLIRPLKKYVSFWK